MMTDYNFLSQLDHYPDKTIYVKIISLNLDEMPVELIEGTAISGSINIDGASAVRRTCQLSLVSESLDISEYNWTLNTKFKVQIGVKDNGAKNITWFNQGTYLIANFSVAYSANNYTINISGKDKMCLLNGELGGVINSSTVFDSWDEIDVEGNRRIIKMPLKQIIQNLVYYYGKEPLHNIIINDLDMGGLELLQYQYNTPLYLLRVKGEDTYIQATLQPYIEDAANHKIWINNLPQYDNSTIAGDFLDSTPVLVLTDDIKNEYTVYNIAKIEFGQSAGYKPIELIYPTELIANAGEAVTSILDKIKNMLGEYEYFYDVDGRFIFQKKQIYLNTAWTPMIQNESEQIYVNSYWLATPYSYNFSDSKLFTTFNNAPNLTNLKNDFTVWGTNSKGLPIHMRYAIDTKPTYYKTIQVSNEDLIDYNKKYGLNVAPQESKIFYCEGPDIENGVRVDWREIIYRMQQDYSRFNHLDDFALRVAKENPQTCINGTTGYEQYYTDIEGFWRQLYVPVGELQQLKEEERKKYYDQTSDKAGWNKNVYEAPENLLFWFDFLDAEGSFLEKYSVKSIGTRAKVENDNNVKAIYYGQIPQILFKETSADDSALQREGYRSINVPSYLSMFSKSPQGKTAKEAIDNALYNHSYCVENINIASIPIYYLQPNTIVHIDDKGDYIITKITIPLSYNGTMNLSGTKIVSRLY